MSAYRSCFRTLPLLPHIEDLIKNTDSEFRKAEILSYFKNESECCYNICFFLKFIFVKQKWGKLLHKNYAKNSMFYYKLANTHIKDQSAIFGHLRHSSELRRASDVLQCSIKSSSYNSNAIVSFKLKILC